MRRVIGQKSSHEKTADYAVVTARPVWAEKILRSIGDDKLLQFEARFADHVSQQFAQAEFNQLEREAAYAHFLHQQISQHGGEVAMALRTELDKHAAETAAGMAEVMKKTGADITHMYAAAGQAFQGLGGDINTLRSQTESAVGDIKSTTATLSQDIAAAKSSISKSKAQAQAHEQEIKRVSAAVSEASAETKALVAEVARQGAAIQTVGTEARKRAEVTKAATDQLKHLFADLANKVEFEQECHSPRGKGEVKEMLLFM
jgi:methyl-accepting chemotaxis protein